MTRVTARRCFYTGLVWRLFQRFFPGFLELAGSDPFLGIFTLKTFVACTTDILKTYDDYFNNPPTLIFAFETDFYESAKSAPNSTVQDNDNE